MKSSRMRSKVTTEHPMHKLWESASDIVARTIQAYNNAKVPVPHEISIPVWVDGDPVMRITIDVGSKTTAEYAIFKAQNKGKPNE
jgi:hypothetical protein